MKSKVSKAILCGAAKGGTSKSTTSVLVALELKKKGYNVVLMDSDIYGSSLPKITGTTASLKGNPKEGIIPPVTIDGIPLLSIESFMNDKTTPVLWKGDRINNYILGVLNDVNFGKNIVDYMVIDLSPGTGVAVQSPMEFVKSNNIESGIVFVSTPQEVSMNDVEKAISAAIQLEMPIIGIVESMNVFKCPVCKTDHKIFGEGAVNRTCLSRKIPYLGSIPFSMELCKVSDTSLNLKTIPIEIKPYVSLITKNILNFFGD